MIRKYQQRLQLLDKLKEEYKDPNHFTSQTTWRKIDSEIKNLLEGILLGSQVKDFYDTIALIEIKYFQESSTWRKQNIIGEIPNLFSNIKIEIERKLQIRERKIQQLLDMLHTYDSGSYEMYEILPMFGFEYTIEFTKLLQEAVEYHPSLKGKIRVTKADGKSFVVITVSEYITSELNEIQKKLSSDIVEKGQQMTQLYFVIYIFENLLRSLIRRIQKQHTIDFSSNMVKRIDNRKKKENKHLWLPLRGQYDLYYLDLGDLSQLFQNNWSLFKDFFPNQIWITSKIDDMYQIRNLVAHNSFVENSQQELAKNYLKTVFNQLKSKI